MLGECRRRGAIVNCVWSGVGVGTHLLRQMKVSGLAGVDHLRVLTCVAKMLGQARKPVGACYDGGVVVRRKRRFRARF